MLIDSIAADFCYGRDYNILNTHLFACLLITTVITITITIVMDRLFIASVREQRRKGFRAHRPRFTA